MIMKLLALVAVATGALVSARNAASLLVTPEQCRQKTQYDRSDNTIVEGPAIPCALTTDQCKRRSDDWVDSDGFTITVVYWSCTDFSDPDPFPGEVCHVYRWHKQATTEPRCNEEGCPVGQTCKVPNPNLMVITCECK
jgi:hypothetical protein